MTVSVRGATAPEMSFQEKYTGRQGVYFCPSASYDSKHWWLSLIGNEVCTILSAHHTLHQDHRVYTGRGKAGAKAFRPERLIVPMEYLT